ncbi:MAG: hypothetical protein ACLFS8_04575 [Clostridia bacterium]
MSELTGPIIRTALSFFMGFGSMALARSDWFHRRLEEKYEGREDAERRLRKSKRAWMLIGVIWTLFALVQILMFV